MIHYTPLPLEDVFADWDQSRTAPKEIAVNGVTMLVEPVNEQEAKIVQIISSNPQDFLDPSMAPGNTISFVPSLK